MDNYPVTQKKKKKKKKKFWGMLKLAQRQGPKYDIGLFHKYVVSPRRFGIGSHRSDWDGGQARFGCTLVSLLTSVVALVESHCNNFFWRDWLIRILVVDMITPCFWFGCGGLGVKSFFIRAGCYARFAGLLRSAIDAWL